MRFLHLQSLPRNGSSSREFSAIFNTINLKPLYWLIYYFKDCTLHEQKGEANTNFRIFTLVPSYPKKDGKAQSWINGHILD